MKLSSTDIVLNKGPKNDPDYIYNLEITGGIPDELIYIKFNAVTDEGKPSIHGNWNNRTFTYKFNSNGELSISYNCAGCDAGHDIYATAKIEYHSHTYLLNIRFKD